MSVVNVQRRVGKNLMPIALSLERSPSGNLLAASRGCSPFSSPRRSLSSPSILRRRSSGTPTSKALTFAANGTLPCLPAVRQPDEKAVASVVMSPRLYRVADTQAKLQAQAKNRSQPSPSKSARAPASKRSNPASSRRRTKETWSGRVYVKFNVDTPETSAEAEGISQPESPVVRSSNQKRKREQDQQEFSANKRSTRTKDEVQPLEPLELDEQRDSGAQQQSCISHVLLAMAALQGEPTSPQSPTAASPTAAALLLDASSGMESRAKDESCDAATIEPSDQLASDGHGSNTTVTSTITAEEDADQSDVSMQSNVTDRANVNDAELLSILEEAKNQNSSGPSRASIETAPQAPLIA